MDKKSAGIVFSLLLFASMSFGAKKYDTYKGLVMCGYQGWFNTPDDSSGRGWRHYQGKNGFKPESCSIDFWPDVSEYEHIYQTDFTFVDGSPACVFSSNDRQSVETHFRWMKEYGIDGVFMQRFVVEIKDSKGKAHFGKVLASAMDAANRYNRAISIMYDLSGMQPGDETVVLNDIEELERIHYLKNRKKNISYLYENKKPLVSVWGVAFNNRAYGLKAIQTIVDGLKERGYSIMLGTSPQWWQMVVHQKNDTLSAIIKQCDILMPWFVGRYNEDSYDKVKETVIEKDLVWCEANGIGYAPLCFPGFSWKNLKGQNTKVIERNNGVFMWKQVYGALSLGARMLYIAMFDEIDEGTAIFKCLRQSQTPLNGNHTFAGIEDDLPADYYLWLTGQAGRMLRKEIPLNKNIPVRKIKN